MSSGILVKLNTLNYHLLRNIKRIIKFPKNVYNIRKIINKDSFYPEKQRKSKLEMWLDNFFWLLKDGGLNPYYISSGMDIKNWKSQDDYLPYYKFCYLRDKGNQSLIMTNTGNYNYLAVIRDKYVFTEFMTRVLGSSHVVPNYALISSGRAYLINSSKWVNLENIFLKNDMMVIKENTGECGDGIYLFERKGNQCYLNNEIVEIDTALDKFKNGVFVVQNVIEQHALLREFKTLSVNTIRIITFRGQSGAINIFSAFLRIGNTPNTFVDNRAVGGLGVGINIGEGTLKKYGIPHDSFGGITEVHKLSGISFEGFQLPYWKETIELVKLAHRQFYTMQTIGWDIVITDDGPLILEGNDAWEIGGPQDTSGGLKKKWIELENA